MAKCPNCDIRDVPVDDQGVIVQHGRWIESEYGLQRMRSYCVGSIGKTPVEDAPDE